MSMDDQPPKGPHGGRRAGAGRKRKFSFFFMLEVGAACESLIRAAQAELKAQNREYLFSEVSDVQSLWDRVQVIPVPERRSWLASDKFEEHGADVEEERITIRNELSNTPSNKRKAKLATGNGSKGAERSPHTLYVPRGTRKRIIQEVAAQYDLTEKQVDNLWQQKRRFEAEAEAKMSSKGNEPPKLEF